MGAYNCCAAMPIDDDNETYNKTATGTHIADSSQSISSKKKIVVLSPKGYLTDIPSWFPVANAHKDIRKTFQRHEEIGKGVTGTIYRITYKNATYAMKQIPKDDEFARTLFITESRCLSKLKHSSIIEFIDMLMDKKYYYLIMEKCDYDLYHIMRRHGYISEKKTKRIIYGLLGAVYYLHCKNVAHRDLKPENIVFHDNNTNEPILIDFGDAEMCKKGKIYDEFVGTPPYMSPERLGEHTGDQLKKADVWALGVIAYEMYSGKRCFEGDTQKQVFSRILNGDWDWAKDRTPSESMMDFINKCLNLNSQQRISAEDALQHSWFADIRKEKEEKLKMEEKQISDEIKDNETAPHLLEKIKLLDSKEKEEEEEEEVQSPSSPSPATPSPPTTSPPPESLGDECPTDDHDMIRNGSFESADPNIQSIGRITDYGIDDEDQYEDDEVP